MRARPFALDACVAALLALPALVAAFHGSWGPARAALVFGPGDSAYLDGFTPQHETEAGVPSHWSTHEARVRLPLRLDGPGALRFRYARVLREPGDAVVRLDGAVVDRFPVRGGGLAFERRIDVPAGPAPRVDVGLALAAGDTRNYGLRMYWLAVETGPQGRLQLTGSARFRAAALVMLFFGALRLFGWGRRDAALLGLPLGAAAAFGLARDPWLVHRLVTGLPEAFVLVVAAGLLVRRWLGANLAPRDVRVVALLACVAFLLRAAALNHPAFHYPDLTTHERLSAAVHEAGLGFLRSPARTIGGQGAWSKPTFAGTVVLPYAAAFHLPFALFDLSADQRIQAFKLFAAALTLVPLVALVALARRFGASLAGPGLLVVIGVYTSRLSLALFPALLGHALDMVLVAWLAWHLDRLREPRVWLGGALLVAAAQLAYVSSINHTALLVSWLALLLVATSRGGEGRRDALRLLGLGLAGALLAVALYYRDFVGPLLGMLGAGGPPRFPSESFWPVAANRTGVFFGWSYPVLAVLGAGALWRRGRASLLAAAWVLTYLGLIWLRARVPDVFRYGHEPLFLTPLVCLAAGEGLRRLWVRGGALRAVGVGAAVWLVVSGLRDQWSALAEQLVLRAP